MCFVIPPCRPSRLTAQEYASFATIACSGALPPVADQFSSCPKLGWAPQSRVERVVTGLGNSCCRLEKCKPCGLDVL
jgi:hypothetical protein